MGCGQAVGSDVLPGYTGLDFSEAALKKTHASTILHGVITDPQLLQNHSFDAVISRMVLLHIRPEDLSPAVANIKRLAKKLIVLCEYPEIRVQLALHCFGHNLREEFKDVNAVFVNAYGLTNELKYEQ